MLRNLAAPQLYVRPTKFMTRMNDKSKVSIRTHIAAILEDSYDEDTVKLLLIDIRDFATDLAHLREICHFVAHPERDQGSIHNRILSRFLRIRYMNETMERAMLEKDIHLPGPKEDFGDYVFRTIPLDHYMVFEKKYFELIVVEGLNDFYDSFFQRTFRSSRTSVSKLVEANYRKVDGKYHLKPTHDSRIIRTIFILETSVEFQPLIFPDKILTDLKTALLRISSKLDLNESVIEQVFLHGEDIVLAMLSLLHDITFVSGETSIGRSFISAENSLVGLYCEFLPSGKPFIFPLVQTASRIENYSDSGEVRSGELEKFCLRRSDTGRLVYR